MRGWYSTLAIAPPLALTLALGAGCFTGTFAAGAPCQSDADCGPQLECIDGYCDGQRPVDASATTDSGSGSTDAATTATSTTAGATTSATTSATSEGATTGSPFLCDKIDILVLFDSSQSMNQWDDRLLLLAVNFVNFVEPLLANVGSYHIGVTGIGVLNEDAPECEFPGALWIDEAQGPLCAQYTDKGYLDENDPFDAIQLGCLLRVDGAEDDERPMEAMLTAASDEINAPGGCNEGFIRKDALLVVMLLTDEDDDHDDEQGNQGSPGDPQFWYDKLLYYKNGNEDALVVGALLGEDPSNSQCPWMLPEDKSEATVSTELSIGAEEGVRVRQFLDLLPVGHAYVSSICDASYVNFFEQFFTEIVSDACEDFDPLDTDPMVPDPTDGMTP